MTRTVGRVASAAGMEFRSELWPNLHHTLYAAAWDRRRRSGLRARVLAGGLPSPLDAQLATTDAETWTAAVDYYDRVLASSDLLFGPGMSALNQALSIGELGSPALTPDLRTTLTAVAPVYRDAYWQAHDAANRRWIADTVRRVDELAPTVVPRLAEWFDSPWPTPESPVRVDVVWVGGWSGAYTTSEPPHITTASGDPRATGWSAAEIMFHEATHLLVFDLMAELRCALDGQVSEYRDLWHAVLFYLTGYAVQDALRRRGVAYEPYVYANGLFDRLWAVYREPVEAGWRPYAEGRCTRDTAIAATVAALRASTST